LGLTCDHGRVIRGLAQVLVVAALVATGASASGGARAGAAGPSGPSDPRLAGVETWAFAIGSRALRGDLAERHAHFDLVIVDGQEAKRRHLRALQGDGTLVLSYLSVGTIETYRPWYRKLKPYRLEAWKDWKGEFFADVRRAGYRRQITRRIAPKLLAKGFDGLFLDNIDMIENHQRQGRGMRRLVAELSDLVHQGGGLLFAQNGYDVLARLLGDLDGWNREDVSTFYDFDRERYRRRRPSATGRALQELRDIAAAGLLVTATDYTKRERGDRVLRAVRNACAVGALPFVGDIDLRRIPERPFRCG
jgi:cysteinyl-tRNA synthetase